VREPLLHLLRHRLRAAPLLLRLGGLTAHRPAQRTAQPLEHGKTVVTDETRLGEGKEAAHTYNGWQGMRRGRRRDHGHRGWDGARRPRDTYSSAAMPLF
jgi:hypothetical protein